MSAEIYFYDMDRDEVYLSQCRTVEDVAESLPINVIYFMAEPVTTLEPVTPDDFKPYVWVPKVGDVVSYFMSFQNRHLSVKVLQVLSDLPGCEEPQLVVRHTQVTSPRARRPFIISASQARR